MDWHCPVDFPVLFEFLFLPFFRSSSFDGWWLRCVYDCDCAEASGWAFFPQTMSLQFVLESLIFSHHHYAWRPRMGQLHRLKFKNFVLSTIEVFPLPLLVWLSILDVFVLLSMAMSFLRLVRCSSAWLEQALKMLTTLKMKIIAGEKVRNRLKEKKTKKWMEKEQQTGTKKTRWQATT